LLAVEVREGVLPARGLRGSPDHAVALPDSRGDYGLCLNSGGGLGEEDEVCVERRQL
jgi:hypothetical protein